ncbi:hypothetical protein Q1695_013339 [Nippostrongylus brasiliensis]|nr:hypothetical protein Q1695_013339 [Nippostrongylus brasiliensis]
MQRLLRANWWIMQEEEHDESAEATRKEVPLGPYSATPERIQLGRLSSGVDAKRASLFLLSATKASPTIVSSLPTTPISTDLSGCSPWHTPLLGRCVNACFPDSNLAADRLGRARRDIESDSFLVSTMGRRGTEGANTTLDKER